MSIEVTDLITQFGAYYKPDGDNEKNLRSMLYKPAETGSFFKPLPTNATKWKGTFASLSRIVQAFQKAFTPISELKFEPNSFDLFKIKIDLSEMPDDIEETYVGFLADMSDIDRAKWPFVRYYIVNHVMPRKDEDLETNEYWDGVFAEPVANTPGAAGASMDGLKKIISGYNTAGRTGLKNGALALGAPPVDPKDYCTYVEEYVKMIPKVIRKKMDYVFMNDAAEILYKEGKEEKYNMHNTLDANLQTVKLFPNIKVQGLESMGDSPMIWSSPAENRIRPLKKAELGNTVKVESNRRLVDIFTDWYEVNQFAVPEFLYHTDQGLAV